MKKIIAIATIAFLATYSYAQESVTPFLKELPQRTAFNPAFAPESEIYFIVPGLGGFSAGLENTGFTWNDMFTKINGDSIRFDPNRLASRMKDFSLTAADVDIPLAAFGARTEIGYFTIGLTNKTRADIIIPKSLTDIRKGNWDMDNDCPIDHSASDLYARAMNYMELGLGMSKSYFNDHVNFGFKIKLLAGLASAMSDDLKVDMKTIREKDRYRIEIDTKGSIKASAPMEVTINENGYVDDIEMDFSRENIHMMDNRGIAFDLGGTINLWDDRLVVGVAATDFGFIKWHDNAHSFIANNHFVFRGVDISPDIKEAEADDVDKDSKRPYWESLCDSLKRFKDMTHEEKVFKTRLSSNARVTADLRITDWWSVGGLFSTKMVMKHTYPMAAVNTQLRAGRWLAWSLSGTLNHGARMSMGSGLVLTAGAFQTYFIADRIAFSLAETKGFHFSWGINFLLGRNNGNQTEVESTKPNVVSRKM